MTLVTSYVESLYTSNCHRDRILACKNFLYMSDLGKDVCDFIITLLEFVLTHNVFAFR